MTSRSHGGPRAETEPRAQSRCTGNTYFKYPELGWPLILRPFGHYRTHTDILAIYTFNENTDARIEDLEIIRHEPWRIASKQRSSSTREYIGAVSSLHALRAGKGEFATEEEFYKYWRNYRGFKIGASVSRQLQRAIADQKRRKN